MTLGAPEQLHALWLVPLLALLLAWALRRRAAAMARLGPLVAAHTSARSASVHRTRSVLLVLALGCVVVALAQPRWGYRWQEIRREGLDVVVVLDVSRSMNAQDVEPSRVERARREVLDLADLLAGDRVGLVLVAGGAHPDVPLTLDYDMLRANVRRDETARMLPHGSDLAAGIEMATQLLGDKEQSDRALIVLSDGEDHSGAALDAARAAAEQGITLFAMGVGTPDGAPIPLQRGGFQKDSAGQVVLSRLDEDLLKDLARAGSGAYVRSTAGVDDMRAIYEGEIRGRLEGAEQGVRRDRIWNEHYQWPLALALLLLLARALVRPGPLRLSGGAVTAGIALLAVLSRPVAAQEALAPLSVEQLARQQAESPDDLALAERLGAALYRDGDFNRAGDVLRAVAERSTDPQQRARSRYNAGLAAYRAGRLEQAVRDWQGTLDAQPDHPTAAANKAAVEQEIAQRLQAPPPEQQPQDGEQGEQGEQQPQDGEPGEQQPQDGEPGEQQPQDGEPGEQPPQDGEQGDPGEQGGQPQTGEPLPPEDLEPADPDAPGDTGQLGEQDFQANGSEGQDGDPTDEQGAAQGGQEGGEQPGQPLTEAEIDAQEADRLLDSVDEGSPRVRPSGRQAGEKGW